MNIDINAIDTDKVFALIAKHTVLATSYKSLQDDLAHARTKKSRRHESLEQAKNAIEYHSRQRRSQVPAELIASLETAQSNYDLASKSMAALSERRAEIAKRVRISRGLIEGINRELKKHRIIIDELQEIAV